MNFDLIARVIPGRTRTMIKNKFKLEDKHNSAYITKLLSAEMRLPIGTPVYRLQVLIAEGRLRHRGAWSGDWARLLGSAT